jgi:hypothetical protein
MCYELLFQIRAPLPACKGSWHVQQVVVWEHLNFVVHHTLRCRLSWYPVPLLVVVMLLLLLRGSSSSRAGDEGFQPHMSAAVEEALAAAWAAHHAAPAHRQAARGHLMVLGLPWADMTVHPTVQ